MLRSLMKALHVVLALTAVLGMEPRVVAVAYADTALPSMQLDTSNNVKMRYGATFLQIGTKNGLVINPIIGAGQVTPANLQPIGPNQLLINPSSATQSPTPVTMPVCVNANLSYTANTGFTCSPAQQTVNTNALLQSLPLTNIANGATVIRRGYYAPFDSQQAVYYLVQGTPDLNAGAGDGGAEILSNTSGYYWHLATYETYDVRWWGAKGDAVITTGTDNTAAIQAAVNYVEKLGYSNVAGAAPGSRSSPLLTLAGYNYCITGPITVQTRQGLQFGDGTGQITACGGTWNSGVWTPDGSSYPPDPFPQPSDPTTTNTNEPIGMIDIPGFSSPPNSQDLSQFIAVNLNLNGGNQPKIAGFVNHYNGTGISFNGTINAFGSYGVFNSGTVRSNYSIISQSFARSGRVGIGWMNAKSNDTLVINSVISYALVELYVDSSSSDTGFKDGHIFAGAVASAGGDATWKPVNAVLNSATLFWGNTVDNGSIVINIKTGPTIPQIQIEGTLFEYTLNNAASWAMPAWIRIINAIGPTGNDPAQFSQNGKLQILGNAFPQGTTSSGANIITVSLESSGSGAYGGYALQWAAAMNNNTYAGGQKYPNGPITTSTTFVTYSATMPPPAGQAIACDSFNVITQGSANLTMTLPANAPVGCQAKFWIEGTGGSAGSVTFNGGSGATVIGTTTVAAGAATQSLLTAEVGRNGATGAATSAEWAIK